MRKFIITIISFWTGTSFLAGCGEVNDMLPVNEVRFDTAFVETGIISRKKLDISFYMNQNSGNISVQGASCYDKYLFQFEDNNAAIYVYDLEKKEFITKIELMANTNNHCNNASFSNIFYEPTDNFPLLYASGGKTANYNKVQVYRIQEERGTFSASQVQEITMPSPTRDNQLTWGGVAIDNENHFLYFYGGTSTLMQYVAFPIPNIKEKEVSLSDADIIDQFALSSYIHPQGATINNGHIYVTDGVPECGDISHLKIIDLRRKEQIIFNLIENGFKIETEGIFFYDGHLLIATSQGKGIYEINNYE